MDIGSRIKELRAKRNITQEEFADALQVSIQTISRWENNVNCPDISLLPLIATFFHVSTDYLLGLERDSTMVKLLKTVETFEVQTKQEVDNLILKFKGEKFPLLKDLKITQVDDVFHLEVTKEFNTDLDNMSFN